METFISYVIYISIFFLIHSLFIVPILMELAKAKPTKNEQGYLRIDKKSFVIQNFYQDNFYFNVKKTIVPKNICQLYWGIYYGSYFILVNSVFLLLIYYVIFPIGFILRFMPVYKWKSSKAFYSYQKYGKN